MYLIVDIFNINPLKGNFMLYFTSDCHFGHKNSIQYCNRPFESVEDMDKGLIERWNDVVKQDDEVWQLGDFTFHHNIEKIIHIIERLNGRKNAIIGNHDQVIKKNRQLLLDRGLFREIVDRKELTAVDDGVKHKIILDHYPGRSWNYSSHGSWQLHGHVHGTMEPYGRSVDVGVDAPWVTGEAPYRPLSYTEIAEYMKTRPLLNEFEKKGDRAVVM